MALAADRNTRSKETINQVSYPVAASTQIYAGALVAVNASGYLVPAANTAGLTVVGCADENVDNNPGSNGDLRCRVSDGTFKWANAGGGDTITQALVGQACFAADDQTVADNGSNGVVAGIVKEIESDGVWVETRAGMYMFESPSATTVETVTSGALDPNKRTSLVSITGTVAYTLANGTIEGQRKSIIVTVAASSPDGTLTPASFADGTSIDLDAVGESVELEWHATGGWRVISIVGATINA